MLPLLVVPSDIIKPSSLSSSRAKVALLRSAGRCTGQREGETIIHFCFLLLRVLSCGHANHNWYSGVY